VEPYQEVESSYFYDGGSIGVEIIDANGVQEQFAIPAHLGDRNPYQRLYVGAKHDSEPGAIEIGEPANTKLRLMTILRDYRSKAHSNASCLAKLSGRPLDRARLRIK
jgi:hypothetical protein